MNFPKSFIPHLNRHVATVPREQLRFRSHGRQFRAPRLRGLLPIPVPPNTFDWSRGEKLVYPIDGNDQLGDCYYAAVAHASQTFTGNSGDECSFDAAALTHRYLQIAGGDNGLGDDQIFPEWKSGIVGPGGPCKILDEMTVDPHDEAAVRLAMWSCGGLLWTCTLSQRWIDSAGPGAVWDAGQGEHDPSLGHAMHLSGLDAAGRYDVRTWGIAPPPKITRGGLLEADSELIVAFSLDQFRPDGTCAFTGLSYEQKAELWVQSGGAPLPPSPFGPPPEPAPPPIPTPVPPAPAPSPSVRQQVDAVFAALERRFARRPRVLAMLTTVQALADQYLDANPLAVPGGTLTTVCDALFASLERRYPQSAFVILMVQTLVDGYLGGK